MALHVELVSAERIVWSGDAEMVLARTIEGDLGILPGHAPMLGVLVTGTVTIQAAASKEIAAVHGGFLSVADDRVSILAEIAELSHEIDIERARASLARAEGIDDEFAVAAVERARARITAAGQAV
jgi:F-type H+-transporting ATPase subunit epsilon